MTSSQLPESISFLLGPPARPDERANFDRYQAELLLSPEERDQEFCDEYTRATGGYLSELTVGSGADGAPSVVEELFEAVLGVPVRIRSHFVGFAICRQVWTRNLAFQCEDILTPAGPLRALSGDDARALAAAISYALKLDWVIVNRAWHDPEGDPAPRGQAPRARARSGAR
jgi:hypothetical protein